MAPTASLLSSSHTSPALEVLLSMVFACVLEKGKGGTDTRSLCLDQSLRSMKAFVCVWKWPRLSPRVCISVIPSPVVLVIPS